MMKTLYYSMIMVLAFVTSMMVMTGAFAQNVSAFQYDPTLQYGSKPQTSAETPGQLHKKLVNARDAISNIMGSKMGDIPFNEVGVDEVNSILDVGIDSSKATLSEEQYLKKIKEIVGDIPIKITFGQITSLPLILANNSVHGNNASASILSPLKQFKSGIKAEDVKCGSNLHLIIKAEDDSFACVSIEIGKKLALRGWATTFGTGMIVNNYTMSCNTAYQRSDSGIAVLYMPTNSVGKVCVRYHNLNNVPTIVGDRIFNANNITNNTSDVTTWASTNTLQGNDDATIVYSIKTGNKTGFYGLSLTCGGIPLAVGYDANSTITASNFPWANQVFHCGVITYDYYIEGIKGIGVRYIPNSLDLS